MTNSQAIALLKMALDPTTIALGAAATALTTGLTVKQIKSQQALARAVHKAQVAKRALIGALAGATLGGVAAGYALGKKQPKKTEKTTVVQPIIVTRGSVVEKTSEDAYEEHRKALRRIAQPVVHKLPGIKKIETAHGSDIVTSSIISDDIPISAK